MAGIAGGAVAFLLFPILVLHYGIPGLLNFQLYFAAAVFVLIVLPGSFPERPPTPPTASAHQERVHAKDAMKALWRKRNPSYWLVCVAGGSVAGVYAGWTTVLPLILAPKPFSFTDKVLGIKSLSEMMHSR